MGSLLENLKGGRTSKPSSRGTSRGKSKTYSKSKVRVPKGGKGGR